MKTFLYVLFSQTPTKIYRTLVRIHWKLIWTDPQQVPSSRRVRGRQPFLPQTHTHTHTHTQRQTNFQTQQNFEKI